MKRGDIAHRLLAALHAHGAREVFGIPGDFALPFFDAIESSGLLPLYTLSHEPCVGFAADAAARIRGGISVAAVTYGAGALNLVNAVAAAYAEKSPVVVVSGGPGSRERASGLGVHHQARTLDFITIDGVVGYALVASAQSDVIVALNPNGNRVLTFDLPSGAQCLSARLTVVVSIGPAPRRKGSEPSTFASSASRSQVKKTTGKRRFPSSL